MNSPDKKAVLTSQQSAEYLGYSEYTLRLSRTTGVLGGVQAPPFLKLGRSVRYKKTDLDTWKELYIDPKTYTSTKEYSNLERDELEKDEYIERLELMLRRCGVPYSVMRNYEEPVNWVAIRDERLINTAEITLSNFMQSDVKIINNDDGYQMSIDNCTSEDKTIVQTARGSGALLNGKTIGNPLEPVLSVIDRYNEVTESI